MSLLPLRLLARAPERGAAGTIVLQRRCDCGRAAPGAGLPCPACQDEQDAPVLQTRLAVGAVDDALEREADHVADRVLASAGAAPGPLALGAASAIRRRAAHAAGDGHDAGSAVDTMLRGPGEPLAPALRAFFEPRFGHDFGRVRIHRDASAAASARAIAAQAYTVGHHVAFASGFFAPEHAQGRHLLAHELAHVVQQRGAAPRVQRQEDDTEKQKKPQSKVDVSIVLTDAEQDMVEGRTYARTVLRVTSEQDAATKLKDLGVPIGTLYVVSHSSSDGKVQFVTGSGTIRWAPIAELGKALKGAATMDAVDFRGCKLGSAPGALESFRKTVGAQSTKGSNCWTFVQRVTPLTYDGAEVTSPDQIPKGMQRQFDQALLRQINGLQSADGKPVRNCLLGLAPGESAGARTLGKIWKQYWANSGHLVASWASPEFNENWQQGSICTKDMTGSTKPCATVEATAASGGASTQGAMIEREPATRHAAVDAAPERETEAYT